MGGVGVLGMSANELLRYYESLVVFDDSVLKEENPVLRRYLSEVRGALEHRAILRYLRLQVGTPICCGDGHCITTPTARCMKSEHDTCPEHVESCYMCPLPEGVNLGRG